MKYTKVLCGLFFVYGLSFCVDDVRVVDSVKVKVGINKDLDQLWNENQDLLLNCQLVKKQFEDDTQYLISVENAFAHLVEALKQLNSNRSDKYGLLLEKVNQYEAILKNEQQNLLYLQQSIDDEKNNVQVQIDDFNKQSSETINGLNQAIENVKEAIVQLQENLATVTTVDQNRLVAVQEMIASYKQFAEQRDSLMSQSHDFANQLRVYLGSVDHIINQ